MKRKVLFSASLLFFMTFAFGAAAQDTGVIEGTVTLPTGDPAHRTSVLVAELGRLVETEDDGTYRIDQVPAGTYDVLAYQSMLSSDVLSVDVGAGETRTVDVELRITPLRQEITVTARGRQETTFQAVHAVTSLDSFDLAEVMAPSLGEVLDGQLGIAKRAFGVGSARPVVRGFDGDRVLIMQDGVSIGSLGSQSADHGEPIDPASVERIEVVKGPATLLYGSNAIGGVVNAVSNHQGIHDQPHQGWRGQVSSAFGSANAQAGGSFTAEYGTGPWMIWVGAGGQRTRDYTTPDGPVVNSKSRISNGSIGFGWFGPSAYASVDYKANEGRSGIPFATEFHAHHEEEGHDEEGEDHDEEGEDDDEGEDHEEGEEEEDHEEEEEDHEDEEGHEDEEELEDVDIAMRRHNVRFTLGLRDLGSAIEEFELALNYSDWNHDEIEIFEGNEQAIGTTFENQQFGYRGVFTQARRGVLGGSFGFEGRSRDYMAAGEEALSPPVDQDVFAVFMLQEIDAERARFQVGGRLETTGYTPRAASGFRERRFTGFSGGVGARFDLWDGGAFVANYTNSYRAPALEELYNFGPHVGTLTFEIGDPNLRRERSNGFDFSLRHQNERVRAEANFFYYDIDGFVYLAPTGVIEDGLAEANFAQDDARFVGSELKLELMAHPNLWFSGAVDMVDTQLASTGGPLPRIPPLRGTIGLDFRYGGLSVGPEVVVADARDNVFSTETPTAGYAVFGLNASYTLPQQHFSHHFAVDFFNIGDRLYRNHLNLIKDLAPEIGRGVRFSYAVEFF